MISTPLYGHLKEAEFEFVYEPAEDTFLMLDALELDEAFLNQTLRPSLCVEVGTGSGCVTAFLGSLLKKPSLLLATDVNPAACCAAQETFRINKVKNAQVICGDLIFPLLPSVRGNVDVLIFNPPYVPTGPDDDLVEDEDGIERDGGGALRAAWAGGKDGREVLDRLLPHIKELLSPNGCLYLVVLEENDPEDIASILKRDGIEAKEIAKRRAGGELLSIIKYSFKK
eukprot:TRINITY_DN3027_c0_g1_i2.p1 TRINITY_DN3027_c0_g1~~TRINITY_DN3027_c0_g1_i2.p1  ORF type:complete len:227 (+),score=52.94 TRINITY_DN3027_c0_g1_i2:230-910(+)